MSNKQLTINAAAASEPQDIQLQGTFSIAAAAKDEPGAAPKPRRFNLDAYNGGPMSVAGWSRPIIVDGSGVSVAATRLPVYATHELTLDNLLGQTDSLQNTGGKITAAGVITARRETSPVYARMQDHAENSFQWQCSIGASVQKFEFIEAGRECLVNGQTVAGPVYVARKVTLSHIAIVALGADTTTRANIAAEGGQKENTMTFEQWIIAQGLKVAELSDERKASFQAAYDALVKADGLPKIAANGNGDGGEGKEPGKQPVKKIEANGEGDANGVDALRKARADEHKRIAAIEAAAKGHPAIMAQAIEENWTLDKTNLEVIRASRQPDSSGLPAIHASQGGPVDAATIEASLCLSGKLEKPETHFEAKTLEAASKLGRVGLQETLMLAASANGWRGRIMPSVFRSQQQAILMAAFGMYQAIAAGFSSVNIGGILSNVANKFLLPSFNAVEQVWRQISSINPASDFKTVTRYRLTSSGEYAKVAGDGELNHGTLGEESYTNKVDTYGKMLVITRQDQINDDLGAITKVPQQLGGEAGRSLNKNFWAIFQDNASFFSTAHKNLVASGGARPWYLLAQPGELATMEVAFLDGRETPVVETAEADFNVLGIQMRSYHDWGCAKSEYRAGIKSLTALSLTALEAGMKLFNDQTFDPAGEHPVALTPALLLVATGDIVKAMGLYKDNEIRDTTASTKATVGNPFQGMFQPILSRYLANA